MPKIKFNPVCEFTSKTVPHPKPAKEYMPACIREAPPFFTKKPEFDLESGRPNPTFKLCMPFNDTFQMGYIQETWTDIWIEHNENGTFFYHPAGPKIMSERPLEISSLLPEVEGFLPQHFSWHPPWIPELPLGYSCILTHPLNRQELPFQTFTGIMDCDNFFSSEPQSNVPFLLNQSFSGLIKKGTPMYQIIPFKRENWQHSANNFDAKKQLSITQKIRQHMWGGYKKLCWKKKKFD